ncbi:MAG: F0F1 ATP synthase subunit gamma, partial [Candidatus Saccharibacteria bacterium]
MASTQALKSRIRSVKSTKQITKAMQMVAASKMRRAQDADKASNPYTEAANELLNYLASQGATKRHPLFAVREVKARLVIVIAADKGLAGAYNSNVMKLYVKTLKENDSKHIKDQTIAVGRRATQFVTRIKDTDIVPFLLFEPSYT